MCWFGAQDVLAHGDNFTVPKYVCFVENHCHVPCLKLIQLDIREECVENKKWRKVKKPSTI